MFVTDIIRDTLTSPKPRRKATAPEMDVIPTLSYLVNRKNASSDDLGLL